MQKANDIRRGEAIKPAEAFKIAKELAQYFLDTNNVDAEKALELRQ